MPTLFLQYICHLFIFSNNGNGFLFLVHNTIIYKYAGFPMAFSGTICLSNYILNVYIARKYKLQRIYFQQRIIILFGFICFSVVFVHTSNYSNFFVFIIFLTIASAELAIGPCLFRNNL